MNALLVSLNFNPGHFSHLIANYKLFEEDGLTPYLYVNRSFNEMDEENQYRKINNLDQLNILDKIQVAVFWFPSLRNIIEVIRLRFFFNTKIFYVYHEPFDSIKNYYSSGFKLSKIAKICLINLVNIPILLLSHKIILPSNSSLILYKKKYAFLNRNYFYMPLLFDDEVEKLSENTPKNVISYIGTIAADHAFDKFVAFVKIALENNWFPSLTFLIATKSIIPPIEKKILEKYLSLGMVVVQEGKPMRNTEINKHFQNSLVVWNAYHRSMQSGVLPKAYMFGTPVIVLQKNKNEFIENNITGILIMDNENAEEIKNAVQEILEKRTYFFQNCRKKFIDTFYYKGKINLFHSFLFK